MAVHSPINAALDWKQEIFIHQARSEQQLYFMTLLVVVVTDPTLKYQNVSINVIA